MAGLLSQPPTPVYQGFLFIWRGRPRRQAIKNRSVLLIIVVLLTGITGAGIAIASSWPPSLGTAVTPTLIATASVDLFETEVFLASLTGSPSTTPTLPPTNTPVPTKTATPPPSPTSLPTQTPTDTAVPTDTPTATPTPTHTPTLPPPTATAVPPTAPPVTDTPIPPAPAAAYPDWTYTLSPGNPIGYLDKLRLVTYYGTPLGRGLGVLGNQPRNQTLQLLRQDVALYQAISPDRLVLPAYHMITTVANPYPPTYSHQLDLGVIDEWVAAAKATGVAVVLDIQPGRANIMDEFNRIRYLLYEPHVLLAIDPEFTYNDQQTSNNIGQLYASQINEVQRNMNGIGYEIGLNRVLILHQFKNSMLPDKELIEQMPFVEMVIDGDGYGSPFPKISNYNQYAGEPGFEYGGFKLFPRNGDNPVMTPQDVMTSLFPPPMIIIYQ